MSKMDGLRAMREAKHAEAVARTKAAGVSGSAPKAPTTPRPKPTAQPPRETAGESAPPAPMDEPACGHRNMSGRTCTREQGHAAKSHRYS